MCSARFSKNVRLSDVGVKQKAIVIVEKAFFSIIILGGTPYFSLKNIDLSIFDVNLIAKIAELIGDSVLFLRRM